MLVGGVSPILEKNIGTINSDDIPDQLATQMMMFYVVSADGKTVIPLIHYPTCKMTRTWLFEKVSNTTCMHILDLQISLFQPVNKLNSANRPNS